MSHVAAHYRARIKQINEIWEIFGETTEPGPINNSHKFIKYNNKHLLKFCSH